MAWGTEVFKRVKDHYLETAVFCVSLSTREFHRSYQCINTVDFTLFKSFCSHFCSGEMTMREMNDGLKETPRETAIKYIEHACEVYPLDCKPVVSVKKIGAACRGSNRRTGVNVARYLCLRGLAELFDDDGKHPTYRLHIDKMMKFLKDRNRSEGQAIKTDGVPSAGLPDLVK